MIHCAFIKDSRVVNVAVFATEDNELANRIIQENGYDDKVWAVDSIPAMYSRWDGATLEKPDPEYLVSIGVVSAYKEEENIV